MSSFSKAIDLEEKFLKEIEKSERTRSPTPAASSSHQRDNPTKRDSHSRSRRAPRRPSNYASDNHSYNSNESSNESKDFDLNYDYGVYENSPSPTVSLTNSSMSVSFPNDRKPSSSDKYSSKRIEKDHAKDERTRRTRTTGILPSGGGPMIEISKITALVEEELQTQRDKHKDQLNRTVAKFKERREKYQEENNQLRAQRDEARKELEKVKKDYASQKRAAERNNRLQHQQKSRIESLEEQRELFEELQAERDALLDEIARAQQHQQKTKDELSSLKVRVREDSQKRLAVMESLSLSWDTEQKEAKQKEALLNSELDIMSKTLAAEQEFLKNKNKEFDKLEAQYRSTKKELRSIKMTLIAKKEEMDDEIKRERESHNRVNEEHKQILKLKNDEIFMAETTIRNMKAELKSTREKVALKEKSMASLSEEMKKRIERKNSSDPEADALREENRRLEAEIKELQKQVESYLANMALQQEFCNSLKSRIYKEQENEQEQVEEIHKLRKKIKKQQKELSAKDLQISQLKALLGEPKGDSSSRVSSKTGSSPAIKKSSLKKAKGGRKGGYRSS